MEDWYQENIEHPLQELVKILRNNGVNTESSCGHKMYIQCQFTIGYDNLMKIDRLIYDYMSDNDLEITYDLTARMRRRRGNPSPYIMIDFISIEGCVKSHHESQKFAKDN